MIRKTVVLFLAFCAVALSSIAQIRTVPPEVTASFTNQYPAAENIEYKDNLIIFSVHFTLNGNEMIAKYTSKGEWKETEKGIDIADIPSTVQEGFEKSKYFDWKTTEAVVIMHPSGTEQYRLKVEKNEFQKKYLFYNKSGRLIRDAITI